MSGEFKVAGIHRTEYLRNNFRDTSLSIHAYEETSHNWGKCHLKELERNMPGISIGLGICLFPKARPEKHYDSWNISRLLRRDLPR